MRYITLPNTNLTASSICLGTSNFGATIPQADAFALMDAFVEQGGNFLDTAHVYANWIPTLPKSISEKTIGAWMKARNNRHQIIIGTKGAHPDLATMHISRLAPADIVQDLNESLQHLQTDYIDLYWLHRDDPTRPVGVIIDALDAQVKAGKIRAFGCSNWSTARMKAAFDYANAHGCHGFVANQPMWSLAQPNPAAFGMPGLAAMDEAMFAFHQQSGWAIIPYTSQARGFFSKVATQGIAGLSDRDRQAYGNAANEQRAAVVRQLAQEYQSSPAQIALAYLLCQPVPTIPVIGCRTLAHLQDSVGSTAIALPATALALLGAHG
ncbi:MAG: aldo/keto reductase [Caldilinea sp. CFX5]|nr:aldo/keto reductase [Caldilinea sp. CFX5]